MTRLVPKGFTLIELIVVIVILGVIAAIAAPRFSSFKSSARISAQLGSPISQPCQVNNRNSYTCY